MTPITVYESTARTATPTKTIHENERNARGCVVVIDVTAASSPSVVFTLQGRDAFSQKYWTIVASAAITGTGTTILRAYPGLTAAANLTVSDILPYYWAVDATHTGSNSATYTVTVHLVA